MLETTVLITTPIDVVQLNQHLTDGYRLAHCYPTQAGTLFHLIKG